MALKFRRGSTQQQSGSLLFGEPFINTTLNTLLIGGQGGDIQLVTTGQTASMNVNSASYALTSSYALNAGVSINTGSLATTGSNVFTSNQIISGTVASNIFLNPNTIFGSNTVPFGHNGLLIGPIISIGGAITIENESNLVII